jgi:hypothetical protein
MSRQFYLIFTLKINRISQNLTYVLLMDQIYNYRYYSSYKKYSIFIRLKMNLKLFFEVLLILDFLRIATHAIQSVKLFNIFLDRRNLPLIPWRL